VLAAFGSEAVPRLRIGIGGAPAEAWGGHGLAPFSPAEAADIAAAVERAADGAAAFLEGKDVAALQAELNRVSPPAQDRGTGRPEPAASAAPAAPSAGREGVVRGGSKVEQKSHKYEGMFLLNNGRISAEGGGATGVVDALLKKHGASVVRVDVWDERKLAYPVEDQKRATYVLAHFEAPPASIAGLNHDVNISEDVLRWLPVRHELEFPPFRTASEMATLQPRKELIVDEGRRRRGGEDGEDEGGRRGDEDEGR
jgi:small subunit ribosomal protein S6